MGPFRAGPPTPPPAGALRLVAAAAPFFGVVPLFPFAAPPPADLALDLAFALEGVEAAELAFLACASRAAASVASAVDVGGATGAAAAGTGASTGAGAAWTTGAGAAAAAAAGGAAGGATGAATGAGGATWA